MRSVRSGEAAELVRLSERDAVIAVAIFGDDCLAFSGEPITRGRCVVVAADGETGRKAFRDLWTFTSTAPHPLPDG